MGNKNSDKLKGKMNSYMRWPFYLIPVWIIVAAISVCINPIASLIICVGGIVYTVFAFIMYLRFKPSITRRLVNFGAQYSQVQRQMLHDLDIPYGLIDEEGQFMWSNIQLQELLNKNELSGQNIINLFDEIEQSDFAFEGEERREKIIHVKENEYRVIFKQFALKEKSDDTEVEKAISEKSEFIAVYFFDYTLVAQLKKENNDEKSILGTIVIDNYDEVLEKAEAARRSTTIGYLDRKITNYFANYDGIVRKIDNDKYFVTFKNQYLNRIQSDKFSLLDQVKEIGARNEIDVTISIGLGCGGDSYHANAELASTAIDLALGRGGDQAVLKNGNKVSYYGGKSRSVQKNSKVKARVMATAFREMMLTKGDVYVMGHHIGDNDSFGAQVGFYRIAKTLGKNVYIVMGEMSSSVQPLIEMFKESDDYTDDIIISGDQALDQIQSDDVLIVVDCSRQSYTECPRLIDKAETVMYLDHHRQREDVIDKAELTYVELSASSSCEMVAEIMQYINEVIRMSKQEANILYSGIMMDTNNFTRRTGVRTFEAAAYLRRKGADIATVHKAFRNDLGDFKAKAASISNAEIYKDVFAISVCDGDADSPTLVGAQVANELLNVKDVKASFVLTPYNKQIYISARALDNMNVQVMMEEFGGGGHMTLAGAQVKGATIEEVTKDLKKLIDKKIKEGEI
ncbi:MAG: DHH family phosphoesterase [Eubacterium sp.]|nr:DHH family phosphoesterase [Eubacterium sp.]